LKFKKQIFFLTVLIFSLFSIFNTSYPWRNNNYYNSYNVTHFNSSSDYDNRFPSRNNSYQYNFYQSGNSSAGIRISSNTTPSYRSSSRTFEITETEAPLYRQSGNTNNYKHTNHNNQQNKNTQEKNIADFFEFKNDDLEFDPLDIESQNVIGKNKEVVAHQIQKNQKSLRSFWSSSTKEPYERSIYETARKMNTAASAWLKRNEVKPASIFATVASQLITFGHKLRKGLSVLTRSLAQGAIQSSEEFKNFADHLAYDPTNTTLETITDLMLSSAQISFTLAQAMLHPIQTKDVIKTVLKTLSKMSYKEMAINAIPVVTKTIILATATGKGLHTITRGFQQFATATSVLNSHQTLIKTEYQAARLLKDFAEPVKRLYAPISTIFSDACLITRNALQNGKNFAQRAISIIKRNPRLIQTEEALSSVVTNVAKTEKIIKNKRILEKWLDWVRKSEYGPGQKQRHFDLHNEKLRILFRRDIGKHAHAMEKHGYIKPVNHYNIEIQKIKGYKLDGVTPIGKPMYNLHIILNNDMSIQNFF